MAKRLLCASFHCSSRKLWVNACCEGRALWKADPWGSHHLSDGRRFNLHLSKSICICEMAQQWVSRAGSARDEVFSPGFEGPVKVRVYPKDLESFSRGAELLDKGPCKLIVPLRKDEKPFSKLHKIAGWLIIISVRWSMSHTTMMIDYQKTHFIQITFFVKKKEGKKI